MPTITEIVRHFYPYSYLILSTPWDCNTPFSLHETDVHVSNLTTVIHEQKLKSNNRILDRDSTP